MGVAKRRVGVVGATMSAAPKTLILKVEVVAAETVLVTNVHKRKAVKKARITYYYNGRAVKVVVAV